MESAKPTVSRTIAVVAIIASLLVGFAFGFFAAPIISPPKVGLSGEIKIGALLPLTGALATFGENSKVAVEIAVNEVNDFFNKSGVPATIKLLVEDDATNPAVALEKITSLAAQGVLLVVGPMASGCVKQIKGYCEANKILIISQSSTSTELSIPGDWVFRFCTDDSIQGPVLGKVMYDDGVRYIVPVWRGDTWGDGLKELAAERFTELGGTVDVGVRYDIAATEFSGEASTLASKVQSFVNAYGADKVGVLCISFEEAVPLITSADAYPILKQVNWYGTDGTALSAAISKDPVAAPFSVTTNFVNTIFTATRSPKFTKLTEEIRARLGRTPETYAYCSYDAIWVFALSLLAVQKYDSEAVREVLPDVVNNYFGASGWIPLNAAGDRAYADYDLWAVVRLDGTYDWKLVGTYFFATDSLTWY